MQDWGFWLAAGGVMLVVAATLIRAMSRARAEAGAPAVFDIAVYRDQLAEIDRDIARGTLPADEGARLRTEVSRRLLDADRAARAEAPVQRRAAGLPVAMAIAIVIAGAAALYWRIGAPGYPDLPLKDRLALSDEMRAARISQTEAEAKSPPDSQRPDVDPSFLDLMEKLRGTMAERPDDLRGLELLARNEAALGNFRAAQAAFRHIVELKGDQSSGEDHALLAEMMILSAGGYVSPQAEAELVHALERDGQNGMARYYSGVMFAQVGRFDRTFILWRQLLEGGPQDAPWIAPIREQMADIAARAGVNYDLPPAEGEGLKGPTAAEMQAAGEMTAEDQQAMIEGMVAQLGARLAAEGGSAAEWARLITSLGMLGRADEARAIYAEARGKFEGQEADLRKLAEAATAAGVAE